MSPFRDSAREQPHCGCGYGRDHPMVSPTAAYSFIGWVFIVLGVSWEPRAICFVCRRCNEELERIDDPASMLRIRLDR